MTRNRLAVCFDATRLRSRLKLAQPTGIDRVEVIRGPNSILFGFGSPAGKINVSSKQALVNKNAYSLTATNQCPGAPLQTFTGLATYLNQDGATPARILAGYHDGASYWALVTGQRL